MNHSDFNEESDMNQEHRSNIEREITISDLINEQFSRQNQQSSRIHSLDINGNNYNSEDEVINRLKSNFILKSKFHIQNENHTLIGLEFCQGGELFSLMKKRQKFSPSETRFYAANVIIGLQYLHQLNIVYKDLKPENILIDSEGYCKISDFGLSLIQQENEDDVLAQKAQITKTGQRIYEEPPFGTPEYLPPEFYKHEMYTQSSDWWALGCFIYELLTGTPPFYNVDIKRQINKIVYSDPDLKQFSNDLHLKDLLQKLLNRDPVQRMKDARQIQNHPWFTSQGSGDVFWNLILNRTMEAPYKPEQTTSENYKENFSENFTNCSISETQVVIDTFRQQTHDEVIHLLKAKIDHDEPSEPSLFEDNDTEFDRITAYTSEETIQQSSSGGLDSCSVSPTRRMLPYNEKASSHASGLFRIGEVINLQHKSSAHRQQNDGTDTINIIKVKINNTSGRFLN